MRFRTYVFRTRVSAIYYDVPQSVSMHPWVFEAPNRTGVMTSACLSPNLKAQTITHGHLVLIEDAHGATPPAPPFADGSALCGWPVEVRPLCQTAGEARIWREFGNF